MMNTIVDRMGPSIDPRKQASFHDASKGFQALFKFQVLALMDLIASNRAHG